MYHVSAQSVDERMINVHYYYYYVYGLLWMGIAVTAGSGWKPRNTDGSHELG